MRVHILLAGAVSLLLVACAGKTPLPERLPEPPTRHPTSSYKGHDVVMFALSLIDTGYRFGGKNPKRASTAVAWFPISTTARWASG
jgi:outer membrane biogenesis lipoprotein LolB